MKTLIEFYDERAIENVIGPEMFQPEQVIYLYPSEHNEDNRFARRIRGYFEYRGLEIKTKFIICSIYKSEEILEVLRQICKEYEDCVMDVTGGTDAILFAAGMFAKESGIPAITYSRKKNRFYSLNSEMDDSLLNCELQYSVEDFIRMTGGTLRKGRVDNRVLSSYMKYYKPFFQVFLHHRREWVSAITFIQRISQCGKEEKISLSVQGSYEQKGEHGSRIKANIPLLEELCSIGFLKDLVIEEDETVSFTFLDEQIRSWLRDVGSVLELYMYKICVDSGIFTHVISSAVVDWDGTVGHDSVSNEIDVLACGGTKPVFISCKACEIKTEALNELAILRDRFGGKAANAIIVTTEYCNAAARHRAAQLGIAVIDLEEVENDKTAERLRIILHKS